MVKIYVNPGDPSYPLGGLNGQGRGVGSYGVNGQAFPQYYGGSNYVAQLSPSAIFFPSMPATFSDGTSNTIALPRSTLSVVGRSI